MVSITILSKFDWFIFKKQDAEDHEGTQILDLTAEESISDAKSELKFVKFQKVEKLKNDQIISNLLQNDNQNTRSKQFFTSNIVFKINYLN